MSQLSSILVWSRDFFGKPLSSQQGPLSLEENRMLTPQTRSLSVHPSVPIFRRDHVAPSYGRRGREGRRQKDKLQSGRAKRDDSILKEHFQSDVHRVATVTWGKLLLQLGGSQSRSGRHGEVKIFYPLGTRILTPRSSSP
jgi:hypothetical protein